MALQNNYGTHYLLAPHQHLTYKNIHSLILLEGGGKIPDHQSQVLIALLRMTSLKR